MLSSTDVPGAQLNGINLASSEPEPVVPPSSSNETPSAQLPPGSSASYTTYNTIGDMSSYSQGQGRGYPQGYGLATSESTIPQGPAYTTHNPGSGRGQTQAGTWQRPTNYVATQPYGNTPQRTKSDFGAQPLTEPANDSNGNWGARGNVSDAGLSVIDAASTTTDSLPNQNLWKGKLPALYERFAVLTSIRVQSRPLQGLQARICPSPYFALLHWRVSAANGP